MSNNITVQEFLAAASVFADDVRVIPLTGFDELFGILPSPTTIGKLKKFVGGVPQYTDSKELAVSKISVLRFYDTACELAGVAFVPFIPGGQLQITLQPDGARVELTETSSADGFVLDPQVIVVTGSPNGAVISTELLGVLIEDARSTDRVRILSSTATDLHAAAFDALNRVLPDRGIRERLLQDMRNSLDETQTTFSVA